MLIHKVDELRHRKGQLDLFFPLFIVFYRLYAVFTSIIATLFAVL